MQNVALCIKLNIAFNTPLFITVYVDVLFFLVQVCVKMRNLGNDTEFMWDRSKFINRKFLMQEMYQDYVNGDDDWDLPKVRLGPTEGMTGAYPR